MHDRGVDQAIAAWAAEAAELCWDEPWEAVYRGAGQAGRWFPGGALNASVNCLDRHLADRAGQVALYWEGEPESDRRAFTYGELHAEVCRLAEGLRGLGLRSGEPVALHLGLIPEAVVAMLACARLGHPHVVLSPSLPPDALADRLVDLECRVLFTQDGLWRHGNLLLVKARADEAISATQGVEHTIVVRRAGLEIDWYAGDRWYDDLVADGASRAPGRAPEAFPAGHPLLMVFLADREGRPVKVIHGTGGFLTYTATLHRRGLTIRPDDCFWGAVDICWLAGQTHGVYGPLACGATTVLYEGMLDQPTPNRAFEIIDRYRVNAFATTPTAVQALRGWAESPPAGAALDSLRLLVTAGEPLDGESRWWLEERVGGGRAVVSDGWGQTEFGGIVTLNPPPQGTGSLPDAGLDVVDDRGVSLPAGVAGELVLRHPWPGTFVAIEGHGKAAAQRWETYPGCYATGDSALRESDGTFTILGRKDAVVSVSGQLVSLTEIADALSDNPFVAQVEVLRGQDAGRTTIVACVVVQGGAVPGQRLRNELLAYVQDTVGGLARPHRLVFVESFPPELGSEARRAALSRCTVGPDPFFVTTAALWAAASPASGEAPWSE